MLWSDMDLAIPMFVALIVVVDPLGVAPMFIGLTGGATPAARRRIAIRATLIAGLVLFAFGAFGGPMLRALGVGLPAFRIAGGILLLLAAIDMLFARPSGLRATTASEDQEAIQRADVSVFPLAIPLIAGPGAITTVMLQVSAAHAAPRDLAILAATLAVVLALSLLSMLFSALLMRLLGITGINVVGRVLGIVLAALAVQLVIDGIAESGLVPGPGFDLGPMPPPGPPTGIG